MAMLRRRRPARLRIRGQFTTSTIVARAQTAVRAAAEAPRLYARDNPAEQELRPRVERRRVAAASMGR
jgi:hypothetical protein